MTEQRSDDQAIYDEFYDSVNMQPKELEEWLQTEESKSVGDSDSGESTGHKSGRRIVEIKQSLEENSVLECRRHQRQYDAGVRWSTRVSTRRPSSRGSIRWVFQVAEVPVPVFSCFLRSLS